MENNEYMLTAMAQEQCRIKARVLKASPGVSANTEPQEEIFEEAYA